MGVVSMRGAAFLKVFSMLLVIVSLVYMYAYSTDTLELDSGASWWIASMGKAQVFYMGLGIFALFNIIMHIVIYIYHCSIDTIQAPVFKDKKSKERIYLWLNFLVAGINICLTTIILFVALAKINELIDTSSLNYLPIAGCLILLVPIVGLSVAVAKK